MADLNRLLQRFINSELRLSQDDISASARSREWLLNGIRSKIAEKRCQPTLYPDQNFLFFGSYFKGTKVQTLDEYDILVILDSCSGLFTKGNYRFGYGLGSACPNYRYATLLKEDGSGVSPSKSLNWLKGIVEEFIQPYGMEAPIRNGQAVTVHTASTNTTFDLVPAGIFRNPSTNEIFYNIPGGDRNNSWIFTNPVRDRELLNEHSERRTNYKNIIRLIKFLRSKYNFLVPSFAIECNSISYSTNYSWYNLLGRDFLGVLEHLKANFQSARIVDTFDDASNTIEGVASLAWYVDRIDSIITRINRVRLIQDENQAYLVLYNIMYNR